MAAEISEITESNDVWPDQIFGYLQAMNAKLDRLEAAFDSLLSAWSEGGMRGLRTAAREHANGR